MSEEIKEKCCEEEYLESEEAYYIKAFERLNKTGKHTWNWAAFLFGHGWMLYRKMYLYSFLFVIFCAVSISLSVGLSPWIAYLLSIKSELNRKVLLSCFGILGWFLPNVLLGYFGNAVYYKAIKKRIRKGYYLLDKYCPTSVPSILGGPVFGTIVCFADWIARKCQLKTDVESEVNEETVRAYLNPNKEIHIAVKIANVLACVFFLIGLFARG